MFIGEFSVSYESPAYLTQTVGMFIGVFLSLKNHLFISQRLLVCSSGSFPVS